MKKTTVIFIILLTLSIIPAINADSFVCFADGETFSFCNPLVTYNRCEKWDFCECKNDHDCGPICMKEYDPIRKCYNGGAQYLCNQDGTCTPGSSSSLDQQAPIITLNTPTEGNIYTSKSVSFDISLDEIGDVYYTDNIYGEGKRTRVFSERKTYIKKISLKEGFNSITLFATDKNGNEGNKTVTLFVDSKIPKIKKTYPKKGTYTTGEFTVEYTEENLKEVSLYINGEKKLTRTDCPSTSKTASCTLSVDVDQYDGQEINYDFKLKDLVTEVSLKMPVTVKVDITPPTLTVNKPTNEVYNSRYVLFDIKSSEIIKLQYRDNTAKIPVWKSLCSKCTEYSKTKSFSNGTHNVDIKATDPAGNFVPINVDFTVSY
ncbi:MAG: hypothetical protein PHT54_02650 [Candidatus Nanoarchaeia archaeon]|nr:hypothetical protein [Candidatus Nanoarchaeia archaeon]